MDTFFAEQVQNSEGDPQLAVEVTNTLAPVEYEVQKRSEQQKLLQISKHVLRTALPVVHGVEIEDLNSVGCAWPLFILYISGFSVVFLYYTITGTKSLLANRFLSLYDIRNSAVCKEIPVSITGTFHGDFHGAWETDAIHFQKNSSIFILQFIGTSVGNADYADAVGFFEDQLNILGQKASTRSVVWSLLAWTTFHYVHQQTNLAFYSNADVDSLFQGSFFLTSLWTNREGICQPNGPNEAEVNSTHRTEGYYETSTKTLVFKIPEETSTPCPLQGGNIMTAFINPQTIDRTWSFSFDVRTLQTTVALNMGLISTSDLLEVYPIYDDLIHGYAPGGFYIDPFYTKMDPLFCIDKHDRIYGLSKDIISGPEVCFLATAGWGGVFALNFGYPIINHETVVDAQTGFMKQCSCPQHANDRHCNTQDLFYSIIYAEFNNASLIGFKNVSFLGDNWHEYWKDILAVGLRFQKFLVDDPVNGDIAMMELFSPVAVSAAMISYGYPEMNLSSYFDNSSQLFYSNSWSQGLSTNDLLREAWDIICPARTCGAFVFEVDKEANSLFLQLNSQMVQMGRFGSAKYYDPHTKRTLPRMMCTDTFSNRIAFENFKMKPPIKLTQPYFECQTTLQSALTSTIGSSYGSAQLYTTVGIAIIGGIIVLLINDRKKINVRGIKLKRLVSRDYKDEVQRLGEKRAREHLCGLMEEIVNQLGMLRNEVENVSRQNLASVQAHAGAKSDSETASIDALKVKLTETQQIFPVAHFIQMDRVTDLLAAVKADPTSPV